MSMIGTILIAPCHECGAERPPHRDTCSHAVRAALFDDRQIHIVTRATDKEWSVEIEVSKWRTPVKAGGPAMDIEDARRRVAAAFWRLLSDYFAENSVDPMAVAVDHFNRNIRGRNG
jgi:hypothetical protein